LKQNIKNEQDLSWWNFELVQMVQEHRCSIRLEDRWQGSDVALEFRGHKVLFFIILDNYHKSTSQSKLKFGVRTLHISTEMFKFDFQKNIIAI
jgi:hypothetical protein